MAARSPVHSAQKRVSRSKRWRETALLAFDGMPAFEYAIAVEVFALEREGLGVPWYRTQVVGATRGPMRMLGGLRVHPDAGLEALATADTIVVPGWRFAHQKPSAALLDALCAAHSRKARLLSICSGAFLLAEAGLLDGKRATTHWLFADQFRARFPDVAFEDDVLYVDEGDIITSAGSGAGIDACLHLVRRDHGARVANMVARRMVMPPHREGGQAQYVETPVAARPARSVSATLDWARRRLDQPISVADMMAKTPMSARTFLRQFQDAVGMAPKAWLQRERIARARSLLETTPLPLAAVAAQCGYESEETFRTAFRRVAGVAPGAYRSRFAALGDD